MATASGSLGALVGPGRSGTTWAGTIVDSCPDVIYRFEPFHRAGTNNAVMRDWFERLKKQTVEQADIPQLYESLRHADPLTNKAPFFAPKSYRMTITGRQQLWPVARLLPSVKKLYRHLYTPPAGPPMVFKEVTFIKPLKNLLERTSIPVVYLVRHPCATVLSEVRGQNRERRPARQRRLRELLLEHAPGMIDQFPEVVAGDDVVCRTALLWRCEVETCALQVRESRHGMLMTYEQLAGDAYAESRRFFEHLGLQYTDQTVWYLNTLHSVRAGVTRRPRRTGWGKRYFSVFRNPKEEKDAWRGKITSEEQRKIERLVQNSPIIEELARLGGWW